MKYPSRAAQNSSEGRGLKTPDIEHSLVHSKYRIQNSTIRNIVIIKNNVQNILQFTGGAETVHHELSTFQHVSGNFCQFMWCNFLNRIANARFQLLNCMPIVIVDFTLKIPHK